MSVTHLQNLIADLHFFQYPKVKQRTRREAQLGSDTKTDEDEDEDEDGTSLC